MWTETHTRYSYRSHVEEESSEGRWSEGYLQMCTDALSVVKEVW